ncbi:MAG: translation initiation factor IF-2 subunit alpha [Candidatus Woesearchaeota archaeon]
MLFQKKGLPEENDLVFCVVTNVQYNSVFVKIEEYQKSGLIHISEISPGRIRNIRDYVKEGKMIVCKVIKIDKQKGHIDLSLRRVTSIQKKQKIDERKQEQKAEKIIESLAQRVNSPVEKVYKEIADVLIPKYGMLQYAFEDLVENKSSLNSMLPKQYHELEEIVKEKIKPKKVVISGTITISIFHESGVEIVKDALSKASKEADISYLGAGKYSLVVEASNYKVAEKVLKESVEIASKIIEENGGKFSFKKKEKKDKE